ncbi:MAG: hypothetical protein QUV05_03095 [Phycisphaerae bacterium]|nr:hypothetical protein [Phycisphaerae bacterium]
MSGYIESVGRQLGYLLSLPERTIRSLAAVVGGTTSLLTDTLFPAALRDTTLYRIFVGDAQRFLVTKIAEIQQAEPMAAGATADDPAYVQKKMVGGALEAAGLLAMHFSPLWVFAIAGDAAAGTNVFLQRLVEQLKRNGVLEPETEVTGLDDLLVAVQDVSNRSAAAVDTPPLSKEELTRLASDMRASYGRMFSSVTNLVPRLEQMWDRMEKLAGRENVAIERLVGILTVDVASWAGKGFHSVLAIGQTGADLFGEKILVSYASTLEKIGQEGVAPYVSGRMKPFLEAATAHFGRAKKTWTETLTGQLLGGLGISKPSAPPPAPPAPEPSGPQEQAPASSS